MQLNYLVAVGFLPNLLAAAKPPLRRAVSCSFSVTPSVGDTCESFGQTWGLSVDRLRELNPDVQCPNLDTTKSYCVIGTVTSPTASTTSSSLKTSTTTSSTLKTTTSRTLKTTTTSTTTTSKTTSTTTKSSTGPGPTMPGAASNCDKFHKVSSGDGCAAIEQQYAISDSQFRQWNTAIDETCTNLWLDYYVCVHVPGAAIVPTPQMPGVIASCKSYYQVASGDTCYPIMQKFHVSLDQLRSWNTQLNDACSNLWVGYYICVGA